VVHEIGSRRARQRRNIVGIVFSVGALTIFGAGPVGADHGDGTFLVTTDRDGTPGDNASRSPSMSASGTRIVYSSWATNLVDNDTNGLPDIFLYDIPTGSTTLISQRSDGGASNGQSSQPAITADGSKIVYSSSATILVDNDTNGYADVFLYDVDTGNTVRVSVRSNGAQGNANSNSAALSADGTRITFISRASNFVDGDSVGSADVFVHDTTDATTIRISAGSTAYSSDISADGNRITYYTSSGIFAFPATVYLYDMTTSATIPVSVGIGGTPGDGSSYSPTISADGTKILFASEATNLIATDTNNRSDMFLYDATTGTIERISIGLGASQSNGDSWSGAISDNGTKATFRSTSTNLVANDTNARVDLFVHDIARGSTQRVSTSTTGTQSNGQVSESDLSADGSIITFDSDASDLASNDIGTVSTWDIFLRARDATPAVDGLVVSLSEAVGRGFVVGTVRGSDFPKDPLSYVIVTGNESKLFAIDPSTGAVTVSGVLDYETSVRHVLTVVVMDAAHSVTATVTVNVSNINDVAPAAIDAFSTIPETAAVGAVVARMSGSDIDGDSLSYQITAGNGAGFFGINQTSGVVTLTRAMDYRTPRLHELTIGVSDGLHTTNAQLIVAVVSSSVNSFDDDDGSIFEADIEWLVSAKITSGCGPRVFCPNQPVTRGQMAAFLNRAMNLPPTTIDFFADDDASIFETDINRLAAAGITRGCDIASFCAGQAVTRGQMAAFLVRALKLSATSGDFFTDDDGSSFESDINRLAASGITKGCSLDSFCPNQPVSRAQMAAFLRRARS